MKRYLSYILITVFILGITLGPLGAEFAFADEGEGGAVAWLVRILGIDKGAAELGTIAMKACTFLLGGTEVLFHEAVEISIKNPNTSNTAFVLNGWKLARDLANLGFVFILIYIGIATILQISSYGVKDLLVKVIIIALLVNFSLIFSQTIISAANVLGTELYNEIPKSNTGSILGEIEKKLAIQTAWKDPANLDLTNILIASIFGCGFIMVTAFVLFAIALMFLIRTVALSLLLIFSPLAFVAYILPSTRTRFYTWLKMLVEQAFFAPAFFFMFYLVTKALQTGGINAILGSNVTAVGGSGLSDFATNPQDPAHSMVIVNFVTLIILMLASLTVGKSMAGTTATYGMKGANWTKGKLLGYTKKPVSSLKSLPGSAARRMAGKTAGAIATGEGSGTGYTNAMAGVGRGLRHIPLIGTAATKGSLQIVEANKKQVEKQKTTLARLSDKELQGIVGGKGLNTFQKTAALEHLASRGNLTPTDKMSASKIQNTQTYMEKFGRNSKPVKDLYHQYGDDKVTAIKGDKDKGIAPLSAENIPKLHKDYFVSTKDGTTKEELKKIQDAMYKKFTGQQMEKIRRRKPEEVKVFFEGMKTLNGEPESNKIDDLITRFEEINPSGAQWAKGKSGVNQLKSSGFEVGKTKTEAKPTVKKETKKSMILDKTGKPYQV